MRMFFYGKFFKNWKRTVIIGLGGCLLGITYLSSVTAQDKSTTDRQVLRRQFQQQANALCEKGQWIEAIEVAKKELALTEELFGPEHTNVIISLDALARFYVHLNKYVEAYPVLEKALYIAERRYKTNDLRIVVGLDALAEVYILDKRYDKAIDIHQRALMIEKAHEKELGDKRIYAGISAEWLRLNKIGVIYATQGKYEEAENLFKKVINGAQEELKAAEDSDGKDSRRAAICLNDLAILYMEQDKADKAEPLFQRVLSIWEKEYHNPIDPNLTSPLEEYAECLQKLGKTQEAENIKKRIKTIIESIKGNPIIMIEE